MKQSHSGLDVWRNMTESDTGRQSIESYLPLILSAAGGFGVFPFMVLRYMQGEWIAAIVDTIIVIGFAGLGIYVYCTRRVRFASFAISTFCITGVLTSVYVIGPEQIYWVYPALMAVFYLLRPREAFVFVMITVAALLPSLLDRANTHATTTILITVTVMSSFAFAFSLITNRQREELLHLATKDPLTGAGNRRHFVNKLWEVVSSKQRTNSPACMLLVDLDHFKEINDIHGHAAGDRIRKQITNLISLRIRVTDSLFRIGGEEFVIVLEGQTIERAEHLAEQLRLLVEAIELIPNQTVTISLGAAELNVEESGEDWLQRADEALYRAKKSGRNSTCVAA